MKPILVLLLTLYVNLVFAQKDIDTTVKVDLLKAPASPASSLLGISPSDIEKPTDVSAFMVSLQTASGSFTKLPSSYAIDIAPYWFFKNSKKGDITTKGFAKSGGKDVFKQTLVLSFAFRNTDSSETDLNVNSVYGGAGFKFYILRGKYDGSTMKALDKIKSLQDIKLRHLDKVMTGYKANTDPEVIELRQKMKSMFRENMTAAEVDSVMRSDAFLDTQKKLSKKLADYAEKERTEAEAELDRQIQEVAASFQTFRMGWTWDVSGGISTEFRQKKFNDSKVYNAGVWTTIGYTDSVYGAGLFLLRLLHNPDKVFAKDNAPNDIGDITTFDAGLRYIYARPQSKFSASVEAIYRSILSSHTVDPSWRLVFNADYALFQNKKITFSFGRNFDGVISKGGNLIAALTFLSGFGNNR